MKKLILTFFALAVAVTAFAERPTGLNLGGGYGMMFYNQKTSGTYDYKSTEAYVGAFAEVGYDLCFGKMSAVYFGARYDMNFRPDYEENGQTTSLGLGVTSYFDIPVKYQIAFNVSPKTKLFFQAGPTVNFWLSNRVTYTETVDGKISGTVRRNLFENGNFNRVNLSLGGTAGVYFNHVKIYAGFDAGLFNYLRSGQLGAAKGYANNLRIGAAYVF